MRKSVIINKRAIVMTGLLLALAAAIYLNWQFSGGGMTDKTVTSSAEETLGQSMYVNKNVTANDNDYFTKTVTSREKSRNETIAELDEIIGNAKSSDDAKKQAENNKNIISANITKESNIETIITAKGFEKCIAVVNESSVNVIVKAKELTSAQTIQINEIVTEQTGFTSDKIKIITVQ